MLSLAVCLAEAAVCSGEAVCLFTGKAYSLTYTRVEVTDAAEIKFVAEKAESRAQLTVKGNYAFHALQLKLCCITNQPPSLAFNVKKVNHHLVHFLRRSIWYPNAFKVMFELRGTKSCSMTFSCLLSFWCIF